MKRYMSALAFAVIAVLPLLAVSGESRKIKFALLEVDRTDPKLPVGVFSFRQTAMLSLAVYGWDKPTNGHFRPLFVEFQLQTNGGWRNLWLRHPLCSPGRSYPLRSVRTYTFHVPLPFTNSNERARVGILTGRQKVYWSDPFRLADYERGSQ